MSRAFQHMQQLLRDIADAVRFETCVRCGQPVRTGPAVVVADPDGTYHQDCLAEALAREELNDE